MPLVPISLRTVVPVWIESPMPAGPAPRGMKTRLGDVSGARSLWSRQRTHTTCGGSRAYFQGTGTKARRLALSDPAAPAFGEETS